MFANDMADSLRAPLDPMLNPTDGDDDIDQPPLFGRSNTIEPPACTPPFVTNVTVAFEITPGVS